MSDAALRTFIAYVEDLPGVLNRVTSLLRRRNYNIVSLTVGRTERAGVSRMTIVLEADDDGARRIEANLYKLVNVLWVEDASDAADDGARARPHQGARRRRESRPEIMQLCDVFRARVVDVGARGARGRDHGHRRQDRRLGRRAATLRNGRDGAHGRRSPCVESAEASDGDGLPSSLDHRRRHRRGRSSRVTRAQKPSRVFARLQRCERTFDYGQDLLRQGR